MNKYEELKNKIDEKIKSIKEYELKLNELKEEIDKAEQGERSNNEIPFKIGEKYYYIATAGEIGFDKWDNDEIDFWRFNQGNAFKTEEAEEEAEDKFFQLKVEGKAREFRRINNCNVTEEDWRNTNKNKYYIYYGFIGDISISSTNLIINPTKLGYFSSKEMTERFVEENKENLLKYFDIEMKLSK